MCMYTTSNLVIVKQVVYTSASVVYKIFYSSESRRKRIGFEVHLRFLLYYLLITIDNIIDANRKGKTSFAC